MSWGVEEEFADVFAGRPDDLAQHARAMSMTAEAISRVADALIDVVADQKSEATDELGDTALETAASLRRAHRRYSGTSSALSVYAVELVPIQTEARRAVDEAEFQDARRYRLQSEISDLESEHAVAEAKGVDTQRVRDELWETRQSYSSALGAIDSARDALFGAREQIRDAADRAISKIETAIENDKDSFGDNWNQFWEGVGDVLSAVGEWASQVLAVVVAGLKELWSAVVSALVVAALLIIGAIVIGIVFFSFGVIGLIVLGVLLAATLVAIAIAESVARPQEIGARTESTQGDGEDRLEARDYADLLRQVADQDAAGGAEFTQIKVVAIRDENGDVIAWRVQLPSTQEWNPLASGALNDVRADVMLSMFPGVPTQYEEAVWDAMTKAGVFESDAPIMFTGWSLGGMMAGDLAGDPRVEGRVESVFTAGAAIDKHKDEIPLGVRVTQVNNGYDPVHTLEFVGLSPIDRVPLPQWETYRPLVLQEGDSTPVHSAQLYAAAVEKYRPEPRPGDEKFFAAPGSSTYEDVYVGEYARG